MSPVPNLQKEKVEACCPCPHNEITAFLGETAILPCHFTYKLEGSERCKVTWEKKLETGGKVLVHCQYDADEVVIQNEDYVGRTSLPPKWAEIGQYSLTLRNVTASDAGYYIFWVTQLHEESNNSMCCEVTLKVESKMTEGEGGGCSCKSKLT
ncbi:butyrophilin subfamily 3 member A2-like [Discoglossus pictus]